jgi:CubicO group peptidase (beta-lactamase class C family)
LKRVTVIAGTRGIMKAYIGACLRISLLSLVLTACAGNAAQAVVQTAPSPAMTAGLATADSLIQTAIANNLIPGAVLVVSQNGKVLQNRAFGYAELYDFNLHRLTHRARCTRRRCSISHR